MREGGTHLFDIVCWSKSGVYMRQLGRHGEITITKSAYGIPAWEVGDDAVRGFGRRCPPKFGLRDEDDHGSRSADSHKV